MRKLKFRVWNPNENIMYSNVGIDKISLYDFKGDNITEQEGLEIMQWTGWSDKNDKDIYEGDIVKGKRYVEFLRDHTRHIGEVVYVLPKFCINGVGKYTGIIHEELHGAYEVIGNIYENPELLEV